MTFFYKKMTPSKFMPRWWYPKNIVPDIYMGLNFGEVLIHWDKNSLDVNILDQGGKVVVIQGSFIFLAQSVRRSDRSKTNVRRMFPRALDVRCPETVDLSQSGIFHHVPWIIVLVVGLWLWYKLVVKTICCNSSIGRGHRRKRGTKVD